MGGVIKRWGWCYNCTQLTHYYHTRAHTHSPIPTRKKPRSPQSQPAPKEKQKHLCAQVLVLHTTTSSTSLRGSRRGIHREQKGCARKKWGNKNTTQRSTNGNHTQEKGTKKLVLGQGQPSKARPRGIDGGHGLESGGSPGAASQGSQVHHPQGGVGQDV